MCYSTSAYLKTALGEEWGWPYSSRNMTIVKSKMESCLGTKTTIKIGRGVTKGETYVCTVHLPGTSWNFRTEPPPPTSSRTFVQWWLQLQPGPILGKPSSFIFKTFPLLKASEQASSLLGTAGPSSTRILDMSTVGRESWTQVTFRGTQ